MQVQGQAAIVTGGGSGLGEATARALAAAGAKVAILDFNLAAAETVAAEIGGIAVKCDVSSAESAEAAVAAAAAAHGPARILINCAGIAPGARVVGKTGPMALDDFRRGIEVNLIGTFNLIRLVAAGAAMLAPNEDGERGVIVNTASIAAFDGQIGIRICTIAPGIFETAMLRGLPQAVQDSLGASVPFPSRLGRPSEYAKLALAIVDNPMLNGEVIRLDGALRMAPK